MKMILCKASQALFRGPRYVTLRRIWHAGWHVLTLLGLARLVRI